MISAARTAHSAPYSCPVLRYSVFMIDFKSPNAFTDPEDPELVADAKKDLAPPTEYSYTEASINSSGGRL